MAKKKQKGQGALDGVYPKIKSKELVTKLERMFATEQAAKEHGESKAAVKEAVKAFVLGLSTEEQAGGIVKIGRHAIPFTVSETAKAHVEFERIAATKVRIKLDADVEPDEGNTEND